MIKLATCKVCGSVYRIEGTPTVEHTLAPRGLTCIICGARLPVPYGTWVIEGVLARGKPKEIQPITKSPILLILLIIGLIFIAKKYIKTKA